MKKLLLDTCTFLWFVSGDKKVSAKLRDEIVNPSHQVFLSAVSVWESVLKQKIGRIDFPEQAAGYVQKQRQVHVIQSLPVSEDCVLHLARLPDLHRDPFDRMLICQALEHGLAIVTPDEAILRYPVKTMWV